MRSYLGATTLLAGIAHAACEVIAPAIALVSLDQETCDLIDHGLFTEDYAV